VYTAGTVHGRSLPEKFVIAIKNGDQWYALPANMSGSGTYAGEVVSVDNINNPTKVTAGPATALYSLLNVYKTSGANDRYAEYGTRVRFLGNEKCLWSNAANGGTGINNGAALASATSDNYEWSLVTTDGITYAINTNVAQKQTEGRNLYYRDGESRFGMYTSGNNSFRFLPVDCDNRATVTATATTYNSIILTWTGKSGTSYNVYIDEGGVTKKTETGVTSPVTISGLSSETNYTWIISPGDKDNDCALSGDFTTNVAPINVTLSCDGTEYHLGPQDKPYTLPTSGVYVNNACTEWTFEGWTAAPHSKSTSKPTLIDQVSTDGTVYAVYKHTDGGGSTAYTLTIQPSDFASEGYSGTLNDIDAVDDSDNTNTMSVSFNKSNAGKVGSVIQFKNNGYIYNTTDLGTISGISTNNSNVGYYINSTQNPSSAGSGGYFKLYGVSSTATSNTTNSIDIHFTKSNSTTYYATSSECCNEVAVPTVVVEPVDVSATISWDNQSGATNGYHITCSNGTDQDVAAGVTSLVISGLSASTSYDYIVTAKGATCNRTFESSFTTASCSDVPTDVIVTPGTHTATIRWTASVSTATIVIYDDDLGTSIVQSVPGQTSPCTISGLNDNTNYYLQVFAGGGCPHPIKPFATQSTAVSIAEWFPDGININLDADETTATVLIEDKQENTTTSTSYAEGLFFSKYYEAYRNVKLWAVFNGTTEKISLANIKVKSSNNGSGWGKDKTTGADDNAKITSLASFGHFETGYIYPGEEIIVYSDGNDSQDAAIISCMENTYGDAYKNDPDSLWYLVKNNTTALSGDDGLLLLNGTDTLDVIGGTNASAAYAAADTQSSWGDNFGWNCDDGEDAEGNTIVLSTNRCLLVRKNTVKSGLNAVAQNKEDFNTLCEEWWGAHVAGGGDEVQSSCDNFSYVGHYDYNKYYAHFDSITTVDELSGQKNEDGTYTIPIPHLDTLSCTMLRVKVYEGGVEKASTEYKVPIMVEGAHSTKDTIFICDYPTQTRTAATCKDCDVVILKGGVLTKASSGETGDNAEVRDLTIYPGGTLIVPEGPQYEYTVNSILFRVEKETAPVAKLKGDLITKTEQVIVTRRIKNDRYYFFSLPYDCNIADICWPNGEKPVRGVDYEIVEYDGARRANEGSTQGAPGHWKPVEGTQLKAGVGYNVAVASDILKELVFPMAIGQTNLTDKEDNKTSNKVTIHQYTNTGTTINNHNWNLVAHPYVSAFSAYTGDKITAGYLEYTEPANPGEAGSWDRSETDKVYLTMPSFNSGGITYTQTVSSGISSLNPFLAVFVQGAGEGDMTFEQSARKLSAPARHLAAAEDEDKSIFVGITLSGNGESDQTNLRIRPDFTDEYQLGYDLEKFITFYTPRPQVYMKTPAYRLAFQAVSDDVAKNTFLPMGVYCYQVGTYTFALYDRYPIDELEAVYLFDKQTGVTTNLLYDSYSFTTTGQIYTNTRFSLNVIVKRRITETPTDVENLEAPDSMVRKILINGHVYIQRGGAIYDVTGKQMLNH
ncbi:MAG: fibronectin type III domain-containing protein, partial [Paludibacteraceae bacterium]|nr:fibronectin type III domain-containing protein [Paludibacteraceae bacterium]